MKYPSLILVTLLWAFSAHSASISDFSNLNKYRQIKISPSGKYLAISRIQANDSDLIIVDVNTMKAANRIHFRRQEQVGNFYWANDKRIVMEIWARTPEREAPVYYGELYAADIDSSNSKNSKKSKFIFGSRMLRRIPKNINERKIIQRHTAMSQSWATVINTLPQDEEHILILAEPYSQRDAKSKMSTLYKLNVYTADIFPVIKEPTANSWIHTDKQGMPILAVGYHQGKTQVFTYDKLNTKWQAINNFDYSSSFEPLIYNDKTNSLIARDNKINDKSSLYSINLDSGKLKTLFTDKKYDLDKVVISSDNQTLFGIKVNHNLPTYHFLDLKNKHQANYQAIVKKFAGQQVDIVSNTADLQKYVIKVSGDRNPGQWFLFDSTNNNLKFITSARQIPKTKDLREMMSFTFKNRDDIALDGYVTFPKQTDNKPAPTVVLIHGNRYKPRDYWDYNPAVQLLANQGYAVVQINYRGSGGYGKKFRAAGRQQWDNTIPNDILDGIDYLAQRNLIDTNKMCAMGKYFGGYLALQMTIVKPQQFKCVVSSSGLYDSKNIQRYLWGAPSHYNAQRRETANLKDLSLINNVKRITAPILMTHGEADRQASFSNAEKFKSQLKKNNKVFQWIEYEKEEHTLYNEENRLDYYSKIIEFLNKYNAP